MARRIQFLTAISLLLLSSGWALAQQAKSPSGEAKQAPEGERSVFAFSVGSGSYLGVMLEEITKENMSRYGLREPRGVGITKVVEGSPAERAGLRKDDVILRLDNETVTSVRKLMRLISEVAPDHTVRLTVSRGGAEQEISATLSKREGLSRNFDFAIPKLNDGLLRQWGGELGPLEGSGNNRSFVFSLGANRRIGVSTTQLTKQLADYFGVRDGSGVLVTSVNENSPAAKAGIKAGDVITEIDGDKIKTMLDLTRALNNKKEGEVTLTIIRDKSQQTIRVTPERGQITPSEFAPQVFVAPQVGLSFHPQFNLQLPRMDNISFPQFEFCMPQGNKFALPPIWLNPRLNLPRQVQQL